MSDIFISYSRKDSEQAMQLAERLQGEGMSVWIDERGIEAAKNWSAEIVDAIEGCKAFLILLSSHSMESENVAKELSIAFENKCKLLPVAIEDVPLAREFKYPLAGVQRVAYNQFDSICHALSSIGVMSAPVASKVEQRKCLMVLPFEDLSPTGDNAWFADGIVSELISALAKVPSLKVIDAQTTKDFKRYKGALPTYAREMSIRYFVQGDVRKFGDSIKISARLLDIESGDHLWQDSHKGTMDEIFDIQEQVAAKVVDGLMIHLTKDPIGGRSTNNAEAYELYLKASDYYGRQTAEGLRLTVQICEHALALDPQFVATMSLKASALCGLYRNYERDPTLLEEAEALAKNILTIKQDFWSAYNILAEVYRLRGRLEEAERAVQTYAQHEPDNFHSHFCVGFFYSETDRPAESIPHFERALALKPDKLEVAFNLTNNCARAHDNERTLKWSRVVLPYFERRLRLMPDDETTQVGYANMLRLAGETSKATEVISQLLEKNNVDANTLYNIACVFCSLGDTDRGMRALTKAINKGFKYLELIRSDHDLDPLREMPEFQKLMQTAKVESNV